MTAIGTPFSDQGLDRYIIIGQGSAAHPHNIWWGMTFEATDAKRVAMAWLICGFSTRIVDLKLDEQGWMFDAPDINYFAGPYSQVMPEITDRYDNLASIQAEAARSGISIPKISFQIRPPVVPVFETDLEFYTWLSEVSNSPPTWTPPIPSPVDPPVTPPDVDPPVTPPDTPAPIPSPVDPPVVVPNIPAPIPSSKVTSQTIPHEIMVNGRKMAVNSTHLSYEEVTMLANNPIEPTITYTDGEKTSGSLLPGQSVVIRSGMRFSAVNTGSA